MAEQIAHSQQTLSVERAVVQLLVHAFVQHVQGVVLHDMRDTGQDMCDGARFSAAKQQPCSIA